MDNSCDPSECSARDLTGRKTAWFLWYVPIILVIVGSSWSRARVWLWVPAFVMMGVGCLANTARCGRIHCYVTGPLFLLAAVFVVLSALGMVPLHPGLFLLVVFGTCCLAQCAEIHSVGTGRAELDRDFSLALVIASIKKPSFEGRNSEGNQLRPLLHAHSSAVILDCLFDARCGSLQVVKVHCRMESRWGIETPETTVPPQAGI